MKKNEIERQIRKYILPNQPTYYVDEHVMYKTFGEGFFIKGYLFYSKGDNEMGLKVTYFVMPLFLKEDRIAFTLGDELYFLEKNNFFKKTKSIWWNVKKEYQDDTFRQISKTIQLQGERILNQFNICNDFYNLHKSGKKDSIRINEAITYSTILFASIDFQDKLLKNLIKDAENERDIDWVHQIKKDAQFLLNTRSSLDRIAILKSWANETVAQLKLPKINPFIL